MDDIPELFDAFDSSSNSSKRLRVENDYVTSNTLNSSVLSASTEISIMMNESIKSIDKIAEVETEGENPLCNETMDVRTSPAKVYPFKLDQFQEEAIGYIDRNESVLVAAHTSAGKTAVAEYAIAKSLKAKQRVIYTSPIKALSNQKFRDLQEEFSDVGLMTGDMTINPSATVLIMTTEILRSMLYRGSEVVREVAWVIYDEVHYMRDKERGVVWEESIILLPHKVRFVFLSATIPNAKEFVTWVSKLHHQPCHVVYTDYRPVPLQHFIFPVAAEGLYLVVDEKGNFREDNFQRAMLSMHNEDSLSHDVKGKSSAKKGKGKNANADLFRIVRLVMDRELDPCIVFSFSKKDCESYALQMSRLDFTSSEEKELIEHVFSNALEALSEIDRKLPQIETILPLLKRGIGIHHGGLLPILKEIIEILFQESLIKCLFATETFSIGINMPARTVVFTNTRKFDGEHFRWITSGEYIQMSGRAGRRGKDDKGIVIQMLDEKMEPDIAKAMLYGTPDSLCSSYHVTYNMVLNMLRVEDADPENLLKMSFQQFQHEQLSPLLETQADEILREANSIVVEEESVVATYHAWDSQLKQSIAERNAILRHPDYCLPFLQPGRLLFLKNDDLEWGWGVLIRFRRPLNTDNISEAPIGVPNSISPYILDVLISVCKDDSGSIIPISQSGSGISEEMHVVTFHLSVLWDLSAIRVNLPKDLKKDSTRASVKRSMGELERRFLNDGGIPLLDPIKDMGIKNDTFFSLDDRPLLREVGLSQGRLGLKWAMAGELVLSWVRRVS